MSKETQTNRIPRNGNVARVRELCDEMHALHGSDLTRKHVMDAALAEGIPKATVSAQWQKWKNGKTAA